MSQHHGSVKPKRKSRRECELTRLRLYPRRRLQCRFRDVPAVRYGAVRAIEYKGGEAVYWCGVEVRLSLSLHNNVFPELLFALTGK